MRKNINILVFIISSFLLLGCDNKNEKITQAVIADSCHFERFVIKSIDKKASATLINTPTAILFLDMFHEILKHDNEVSYDSLPEKLKNDNRQTIYRIVDQQGFFGAVITPVLDSLKVNIIEGKTTDSILTFTVERKSYTIDITRFKENDGVVYFTPGKKPVLRNLQDGSKYCSDVDFVKEYFK